VTSFATEGLSLDRELRTEHGLVEKKAAGDSEKSGEEIYHGLFLDLV